MEKLKKISMISETDNTKNETFFCVFIEYDSGAEYRKWFARQTEAEAFYDYYLKANNEQTLWTVLESANVASEISVKDTEGNVIETRYIPSQSVAIDIIGTIYTPTGNVIVQTIDDHTYEVPELEAVAIDIFSDLDSMPLDDVKILNTNNIILV